MKYVVIDIETGGIPGRDGNVEDLPILEFGAVIEDTNNLLPLVDIPQYNRIILHDTIKGGVFALNMNARIIKILADRQTIPRDGRAEYDKHYGIIELKDLAKDFFDFLYPYFGKKTEDEFTKALGSNYKEAPFVITPAGKNFDAFDRKFIDLIPKWSQYINLRHRTLDPTTAYVDWYNDETPPGLGECLQRAGIIKQVTHHALSDCLDTLQTLRAEYNIKKPWMK